MNERLVPKICVKIQRHNGVAHWHRTGAQTALHDTHLSSLDIFMADTNKKRPWHFIALKCTG